MAIGNHPSPAALALVTFVFRALTSENSYAGGGKATPITTMPGWKRFRVEDRKHGHVLVDDYWTNRETGMSGGYICTWRNEEVVMYMTYFGSYPKEVTPFLRKALLAGLTDTKFFGFRGPEYFTDEEAGLSYINTHNGGPSRFWGEETIQPIDRTFTIGHHAYHGWMHL